MTTDDRFDRAMSQWFDDAAPAGLPGRVLEATFEQTRHARQDVGWRTRLRTRPRSVPAFAGAATVMVAVVLALQSMVVMAPPPGGVDLGLFAPVAGQIVYGTEANIEGIEPGIWGVDPAAPEPAARIPLTSAPGVPLGWSSDGTRLLIQKDDEDLLILHADGSETRVTDQLSGNGDLPGSSRPSGAAISPDGTRVVFADQTTGPKPDCHDGALFAVDADGGPAEVLFASRAHDGIVRDPTFSPDGTRIAFVDGYCDNDHSVWVMNADGSDARQIVTSEGTPLGATHVHGLAWSPAGDRIAIKLDEGIFTFTTEGRDFRLVTTAAADPSLQPYWSPDGSRIAYTTGCDAEDAEGQVLGCVLTIANADGSNVQQVGAGVSGPWHPGVPLPPVELVVTPTPDTSPAADQTATTQTSGGMWPQTSLEEIREAQASADAGDPEVMFQVTGVIEMQLAQHHPKDAPIFLRFLEEKLGWENYRWDESFAHPDGLVPGDVVYVRCADGDATDRYRSDPGLGGCAPTIDDVRYETVKINIAQPDRQGPGGIWVVTGWEIIEPAEQVAPPSEAEIQASLGGFLQARIDGKGAEAFVDVVGSDPLSEERVDPEIPLLYATSTGAPYLRSEFDLLDDPAWPSGAMRVVVRLFSENDETVVEQWFSLERDGAGRVRVVFHFQPTTENGSAVPVTYGFLDGLVTYRAGFPLEPSQDGYRDRDRLAIDGLLPDDDAPRRVLVMLADPRPIGPDCSEAAAPADAQALARSIGADPDFQATAPVAVTIGAIAALQMDVVAAGANPCFILLKDAPFTIGSDRARLFLLDLPAGSGARVLAIATITDEDSFETLTGWAKPVVDSIEIHAP
jgi:hypothetical protein